MPGPTTGATGTVTTGGASAPPYQSVAGRRDEALTSEGLVRPEWSAIFESVARHGTDGLSRWRRETARVSRERGLAYRPDRIDAGEAPGNWRLDPIPWVMSKRDWAAIESGLAQRMRLYAAMLADLYGGGEQILNEKLVPPAILYSHPGYLRSLHDAPPAPLTGDDAGDPGRFGLGMAAVDLGRDNSGRTFALNDRFDCPFGLGLALENRTVVNTVLPNLFHRNRVRRIGHFFLEWFHFLSTPRHTHGGVGPSGKRGESGIPRLAILDATPADKDSEISFLANYCGILRVAPSDLTVRGGRVWLKTIGGLEAIDVIWKYTDGRALDPLETGAAAGAGVAGLFEALRRKTVAIASHPGCEVLQSPGLYPFLARVCRSLLGEELLIPPVATWWCGEAQARSVVLDNLSTMVIKPVGPHHDFQTRYGSRLNDGERAELRARIEAEPERFVGQEEMRLSTLPVSSSQGLVPRGVVLRTFSFINADGEPRTMPGGLARVSSGDGVVVSTRQGGQSKDVWVRSDEEDRGISIARELRRLELVRPDELASFAAENLFWAGRNAERTDFVSRFAKRIIDERIHGASLDADHQEGHEAYLLEALFSLFECESWLDPVSSADDKLAIVLQPGACPASIDFNLANLRRTTAATREHWSPASIRTIETVCLDWSRSTTNLTEPFAHQAPLESLQLHLAAFLGLNSDTMTRDDGWVMLDAGRRIERAVNLLKLLLFVQRHPVPGSLERLINESILVIFDSLGTYQSIWYTEPRSGPILHLLLAIGDYPRSLMFLVNRLRATLRKLPAPLRGRHPMMQVEKVRSRLGQVLETLPTSRDRRPQANVPDIEENLESLLRGMSKLSERITAAYFSHAKETVQ